MLFKARTESILLKILRILNTRLCLTVEEQKYYLNLEKGYEGEVQFDLLTEKLQRDCLILNDLLFEINNTTFQIDSAIIYQETIYLFEIKNYEGDYCYEPDSFETISGKEIKNPLDQLKRSKSLFRQLLKNLGYNLTIEAYVIFINPEFTLYQAPLNLPFIFPTQLNRFFKKLNTKTSSIKNFHKNLADKLVSLHQTTSPIIKLPTYEYTQLKKGITCKECHSFSISTRGYKVVCSECNCDEKVDSAVMRGTEEFMLVFPTRKVTTFEIHEWCGMIICSKRIRRILRSNFNVKGSCKWTYFE